MNDPYRLLGVAATADDETIRAAYLAAVRACPPERDPQRFEQVRAAFEAVANERMRLAHELFNTTPLTLDDVLAQLSAQWRPAAPSEAALYRVLGRQD